MLVRKRLSVIVAAAVALACWAVAPHAAEVDWLGLTPAGLGWTSTRPLVFPVDREGDHYFSIKDPSIVRHQGKWHLFCTIRGVKRSHQIEYLSFEDWNEVENAERHVLALTDGYFCAPQIFYFRPHQKWYLIYQIVDETRKPALQPAFSTTADISDPGSWTAPEPLYKQSPGNVEKWIDFWVISDDQQSYLFFTSLDGKMWVSETAIGEFPHGWGEPRVVLEGDIYEASHTYKIEGRQRYLTFIEARHGTRRYFKAYEANNLGGEWRPLADSRDQPFVGPGNVEFEKEHWSESFSHGEFLRNGIDELLEVDPARIEMIYQGTVDEAMIEGRPYGEIPWRLGLLRPRRR